MTAQDYQQLDYAYGRARERIEELNLALNEREGQVSILTDLVITHEAEIRKLQAHATALAAIVTEHEATIQKLSFERDAQASERQMLAAKLDAVPVKEIRSAYLSAYYDGSDVLEVRDWLIEQGVELP